MRSVAIGVGALIVAGCVSVPWYARSYRDGHVLARIVYDEGSALTAGRTTAADYVPLLTNTTVLFRDADSTAITVRDLAFAILYAAWEVELPEGSAPSKLISCYTKDGKLLYRAHVPLISDQGFQKTIEAIRSAKTREQGARGQ